MPEPSSGGVPPAGAAPDGATLPFADPAPVFPRTEGATAPPDTALPEIPGFVIETELGRGGMGVVYRARQAALDRPVALKMILAGAFASSSDRARFRREAEAVARLRHPGIVQVYEVGEHQGRPFIVLEFCDGGSLDSHLRGTPLPPPEAARLIETLARAVHYAHGQGIVHRDLKPHNVLLTSDGALKITDFGLAKRLGESGPTVSGAILGTPSYMAPEQADGKGREVGPAADVYALGAILYELLTGRPPFKAATPLDTVMQVIADEPVPPGRLQRRMPRDVETICLKCLEKDPGKRYGSARELAEDLARFGRGEPIRARPVGRLERAWRWCRRNPVVAGLTASVALLVAALTVGALTTAWRERELREAADLARREAEAQAEEGRRRLVRLNEAAALRHLEQGDYSGALVWFAEALAHDKGERGEVARLRLGAIYGRCPALLRAWHPELPPHHVEFSPDGRLVLAACGGANRGWSASNGEACVWDVQTGQLACRPVRHTGFVVYATFSPDGRTFVTASTSDREGAARLWHSRDGTPRTPPLRHRYTVNHAAFSRDGRLLVTASGPGFGKGGEARVWDAATGAPVTGPLAHEGPVHHAAFSPDGKRLATASGLPGSGEARVWDAASGRPLNDPARRGEPLLRLGHAITRVQFSPDGERLLAVCPDGLTALLWDLGPGPAPRRILLAHRGPVHAASFSPDGGRVVTASGDGTAQVWDAARGLPAGPPLRHAGPVQWAAFSPDGRRVLTGSGDAMAREGDARVWDANSGEPLTPLLTHNGAVRGAAFSPDGRRVLTAGNDRLVKLWRSSAPTPATHYLKKRAVAHHLALSDDGRRLAVQVEGRAVQIQDTAAGAPPGPEVPHPELVANPLFRAGGRRLLTTCANPERKGVEVRVWELPSGRLLTGPVLGTGPSALSADGRLLATAAGQTVRVRNVDTGAAVGPELHHGQAVELFTLSADGRYLAAAVRRQAEAKTAVLLWEAATGRRVTDPLQHPYTVGRAEFSGDGRRLLTASSLSRSGDLIGEGEARVWDVASGALVGAPLKHGGALTAAHFSPDAGGRLVLTASNDRTARIWDTATARPLTPPLGHPFTVYEARFSPDGRFVLTLSGNGVRVWEAATGMPLTPPLRGGLPEQAAAFTPDGHALVTAGVNERMVRGAYETWALSADTLSAAEWARRARRLSGRYLDATGGLVPLEPEALLELLEKK